MRADDEIPPSPALSRLPKAAALVSMTLGLLVIAGWWLNVPILQTFWQGRPPMQPPTAFSFLFLGASLWLILPPDGSGRFRMRCRIGQALALLPASLGLAALVHFFGGWDPRIMPAWFAKLFISTQPPAFPSALSTLGFSLGILLLEVKVWRVWLSEVFSVITIQMALLGLIGHLFGVSELYGSPGFLPGKGMALHTAGGFLMVGAGLLCARPDRGLMAVLRSYTPGGTMARRWLIVPTLMLLAMGVVYLVLNRAGGIDQAIASWVLFMTSLTLLTIAVWVTADALHRAGLERDQAQLALEQGVRERTAELHQAYESLQAVKDELARTNQHLETTVQERTLHLNETIRSLETVCYNIAHDLRGPNRTIAGFADVLLDEHSARLDQTACEYLHRIAAAARRSDALTLDLLAYGRLGHAELPCSKQSLQTHLQHVLDKLRDQIAAQHATISVEESLPNLWANPTALDQILTNVLSNALKFVPDGVPPKVQIHTRDAGQRCRVMVQDNGIGIPMEHQATVFGVFQRLHPPDKYPGSGIGLAIVQKCVERMGGAVGVESSGQNGSCFWFELRKA